jgi:phosphohistidine phosphatase
MPKESDSLELLLWRHADAEDGYPDAARSLTRRGLRQAQAMARWLSKRLPGDYRMIVSPAMRAQQTARALREHFETDAAVALNAHPAGVLAAAGWESSQGTVVVVGHQPTLGRVAALLLAGTEDDWAIKKGAIWWFSRTSEGVRLRASLAPDLL